MLHLTSYDGVRADLIALQAHAERAGAALACVYASSAEFEAAVFRSHRAAALYGRRRLWRSAMWAGVVAIAITTIIVMI
jgi:hypothetical protein